MCVLLIVYVFIRFARFFFYGIRVGMIRCMNFRKKNVYDLHGSTIETKTTVTHNASNSLYFGYIIVSGTFQQLQTLSLCERARAFFRRVTPLKMLCFSFKTNTKGTTKAIFLIHLFRLSLLFVGVVAAAVTLRMHGFETIHIQSNQNNNELFRILICCCVSFVVLHYYFIRRIFRWVQFNFAFSNGYFSSATIFATYIVYIFFN